MSDNLGLRKKLDNIQLFAGNRIGFFSLKESRTQVHFNQSKVGPNPRRDEAMVAKFTYFNPREKKRKRQRKPTQSDFHIGQIKRAKGSDHLSGVSQVDPACQDRHHRNPYIFTVLLYGE